MPRVRLPGDLTLNPGELFVGEAPQRVRTLLGSCVTITLWHPPLRVGAMSHCLLPGRARPREAGAPDGRYLDEALAWMTQQLARRGAALRHCEAKLFGGGQMFADPRGGSEVGRRNGEAARRLLAQQGLEPVAEDLFGTGHRQLLFDLRTGTVWCQLKGTDAP
jgi:chemotaxis protein CheD